MMLVDMLMNVALLFMLISFFNLIRYVFKVRKVMKMHKDNPNIKGFTIVNGQVKPIEAKDGQPFPPVEGIQKEQEQETVKEMVTDPVCGKQILKEEAFRIVKAGKEYFFCSWECREAFFENLKGQHETLV